MQNGLSLLLRSIVKVAEQRKVSASNVFPTLLNIVKKQLESQAVASIKHPEDIVSTIAFADNFSDSAGLMNTALRLWDINKQNYQEPSNLTPNPKEQLQEALGSKAPDFNVAGKSKILEPPSPRNMQNAQ